MSCGIVEASSMHTFKVFKKTTRFKKFSKGITSFVRRKNIKRKVKSSLIFSAIISAAWLKAYLYIKRSLLARQAMYTTQFIVTVPSSKFTYNKNSSTPLTYNYTLLSKHQLPYYFSGYSQLSHVNKINSKSINSVYLGSTSYNADTVAKISPGLTSLVPTFGQLATAQVLRFIKEVRKIIIYLAALHSFK